MSPLLLLLVGAACNSSSPCAEGFQKEDGVCVPDEGGDDTGAGDDTGGGDDTGNGGDDTGNGGDDSGNGSIWDVCADGDAPFTDLQSAVDAAQSGDIINICSGTYDHAVIAQLDVTLRGQDTNTTVIYGDDHPALRVEGGAVNLQQLTLSGEVRARGGVCGLDAEGATMIVESVAVGGCHQPGDSEGIGVRLTNTDAVFEAVELVDNDVFNDLLVSGGTFEMRHCVVKGHALPPAGKGGLLLAIFADNYEVSNCLITDNMSNTERGFVELSDDNTGSGLFTNNLVANNSSTDSQAAAVEVRQRAEVLNNIVVNNSGDGFEVSASAAVIGYNLSYGHQGSGAQNFALSGGASLGEGNLEQDPRLTDEGELEAGVSPAIDAGDPRASFNDVDGSRNDMGAWGGPEGAW